MNVKSALFVICIAFGLTSLSSCDSTSVDTSTDHGRLRLLLTDAPFPYDLVDSTLVTITRVEIIPAADSLSKLVLSTDTLTFNLLDLQNGVTAPLADSTLPAGDYSQLRLLVDQARVILTDSTEFNLKIPGGSSSGLKILLHGLTIGTDSLTTATLDFDLEKSFIVQGNPSTPAGIEGFLFKPVIKPIGFSVPDSTEN